MNVNGPIMGYPHNWAPDRTYQIRAMIIHCWLYSLLLVAFTYCIISIQQSRPTSTLDTFIAVDYSLHRVNKRIVVKREKTVYEKLLRFRNHTRVLNSNIDYSEYKKKEIVLFVVNFHFILYSGAPFIEHEYFPEFAKHYKYDFDVIMIGPSANNENNIVVNRLPEKGYYSYHSLVVAYSLLSPTKGFHYKGYFLMNDDSCVDPTLLNTYDHSSNLGEHKNEWTRSRPWMWNVMKNQDGVLFPDALFNAMKQFESDEEVTKRCPFYQNRTFVGWSDFFYVCERDMPFFLKLEEAMYKHLSFLELAVPNILACLNTTEVIDCNHGNMPQIENCVHVHPVKYSWNRNKKLCMRRLRREVMNDKPSISY